jgi:ABC-type antimicrobial peptide transport system permease subunit
MLFTHTFGSSLTTSQEALQSDALAQGMGGALQLNALTLLLFSVTTFFLAHFVAAQERVREFGLLRMMGLSARQLMALLVTESTLVLLLGLLAGMIVGSGLSYIMIPYLSQAFTDSLAGIAIERILIDWPAIARLFVQLLAIYGSALVLLVVVLTRTRMRQALWTEDE